MIVFISSECETNNQGNQKRLMVWQDIYDSDWGLPEKHSSTLFLFFIFLFSEENVLSSTSNVCKAVREYLGEKVHKCIVEGWI